MKRDGALVDDSAPYGQIREHEIETRGPEQAPVFQDKAALRLVWNDYRKAEQWIEDKSWALNWRENDILYQSPRTIESWGSGATKANVRRFTVAKHVNTLVPTMMSGVFYDSPPFQARPYPGTTEATQRARMALYGALLNEIDFEGTCEEGVECQTLNGTAVFKYGWATTTEIRKTRVRREAAQHIELPLQSTPLHVPTRESDDFVVKRERVKKNRPFFEFKRLGTVFPAPGWRNANQIHKAKYIVEKQYLTFEDINKLRKQDDYHIPSEEELKGFFFPVTPTTTTESDIAQTQVANSVVHHAEREDQTDTEDPLGAPIAFIERWDKWNVMAMLEVKGRKLLIRNSEHLFGHPPYLSCNWWNIQNAGWGLGIGCLVGTEQRLETGTVNAAVNVLSMAVNQTYLRNRGANVPTQQIRQRLGGIIDVDGDVDKAFRILETPQVPAETWAVLQNARDAGESVSGADQAFVQGQLGGRGSSAARTATGAGNIAAASATRIQGPLGKFVKYVLKPFIYALDEMVNEFMPPSEIREILADELGHDFELDMDNFLNARLKYEVLAGARLQAKKAMAQQLPMMIQLLDNPHLVQQLAQTGWVVDVKEFYEMLLEVSEWKNARQLVRPMTDEERQFYQQQSSGPAAQAQAKVAAVQAKGEVDSKLQDQGATQNLASRIFETVLDRAGGMADRNMAEKAISAGMTQ